MSTQTFRLRNLMMLLATVLIAGTLVACDDAPDGMGGGDPGAPPAMPTQ